jgi:hypothetical protein
MPRLKQTSKQKHATKAAAVMALGVAGVGSASASTMPTANIPWSDNASPGQRFVLGEEEMADVSLATFNLFDRETKAGPGPLLQMAACGCGRCGGCGCRGCGCRGCGGCRCGGGFIGGCGGCIGIIVGCAACAGCAGCCLSWGACRFC